MKTLAPIAFGLCYVLSAHFAYGFACIGATNSWMMAGNQSPCDTYQSLIRLCIPGFALGSLSYGQHYATGPEACGCNTVAASLVAACSDCQNSATYDGPLYSWYLTANTGGTNRCTSITNGSISTSVTVPDSIRRDIPTWAYIDINLFGGFWSYSNAHTVAFGGSLSSTLTTSTTSGTSSSASVVTQTITPASTASTGVPLGAVVGAVVGGFVLLIAVVAGVLLWMRKKKKKSAEKALLAHRQTPSMSYYGQSQSPTSPNYGHVESTIERSNRPGVLEHNPSYFAKTPDPPGSYAAGSISPTLVASDVPPLAYSPPPPATPAHGHGYYQPSNHQTNVTPSLRSGPPIGGPSPPLSANPVMGPPDYRTAYNH